MRKDDADIEARAALSLILKFHEGRIDYAVTSSRLLSAIAVLNPVWARRIASRRVGS